MFLQIILQSRLRNKVRRFKIYRGSDLLLYTRCRIAYLKSNFSWLINSVTDLQTDFLVFLTLSKYFDLNSGLSGNTSESSFREWKMGRNHVIYDIKKLITCFDRYFREFSPEILEIVEKSDEENLYIIMEKLKSYV